MKRSLLLLLIHAASTLSARCQPISDAKMDTIRAICMIKHYAGFYLASESSVVGQNYIKFSHALSTKDLVELTNYENPATRCYAFFALSEKRNPLLDSIFQAHLQDTARIHIIVGDEGDHEAVGDFFYNVLTDQLLGGFDLSSPVKRSLDSLILFRPGALLKTKDNLLKTLPFKKSWMPRLREIAVTEKNKMAVVTLSKYHDPTALPLIPILLSDPSPRTQSLGLVAVRNWPDPAFFPHIKKVHESQIVPTIGFNFWQLRVLYQAIVQYKDSASRQLLFRTLKKSRGWVLRYHSEAIWVALNKYPDPIYADILHKLKFKREVIEGLRQMINENEDWEY